MTLEFRYQLLRLGEFGFRLKSRFFFGQKIVKNRLGFLVEFQQFLGSQSLLFNFVAEILGEAGLGFELLFCEREEVVLLDHRFLELLKLEKMNGVVLMTLFELPFELIVGKLIKLLSNQTYFRLHRSATSEPVRNFPFLLSRVFR